MKEVKKNIPQSPGVYLFKDKKGKEIYVGRAGNLKRRVKSYFKNPVPKIKKMVEEAFSVDFIETETVIEALILEAKLIKKLQPFYNIKDKDDRSFLYVAFSNDYFPRVLLLREKESKKFKEVFGPFTSSSSIYRALRIIRKIFPYSIHEKELKKPCFDYQIGLCPGTCINAISRKDYLKNIRNIREFFKGNKRKIIRELKKEMEHYSKSLQFEKAEQAKRKMNALLHIRDTALISAEPAFEEKKKERWEGYDISNISGDYAVGSMTVFIDGRPEKKEYRIFKIRTVKKINDTAMLREVIERRFKNNWAFPDLILVDGGKAQKNAVEKSLATLNINIPVVGIAKGKERKKNEFIGNFPEDKAKALIFLRDEAHRFALKHHKKQLDNISF